MNNTLKAFLLFIALIAYVMLPPLFYGGNYKLAMVGWIPVAMGCAFSAVVLAWWVGHSVEELSNE